MANPIEIRQWMPLYTLDHARAGINPIKQVLGPNQVEAYAPPVLQYRCRVRNGDKTEWTDWQDVGYEREEPTP